jgi:hypothetical protein
LCSTQYFFAIFTGVVQTQFRGKEEEEKGLFKANRTRRGFIQRKRKVQGAMNEEDAGRDE